MKPYLALLLVCGMICAKLSRGNYTQLMDDIPDLDELNIIKVLNTTERQWFYQTSYTDLETLKYTCLYNTMNNISIKEYNFTQTFRLFSSEERNITMTGTFVERQGKPPVSMLVKNMHNVMKQHTLMFWDGYGCSVFYVNLYNNIVFQETPICDMYLTDSYVDQGPGTSCQNFYLKKCRTPHVFYEKQCKLPLTTPPPIPGDTATPFDYDDYTPSYINLVES